MLETKKDVRVIAAGEGRRTFRDGDVKSRKFVALQIGVLSLVAALVYFSLWLGHPEKKRMLFGCIAFIVAGTAWIYGSIRRR